MVCLLNEVADVGEGLQRGAHVVGHGVGEGLEFAVCGLQLSGAFFHTEFEAGFFIAPVRRRAAGFQ